MGSTQSKEPAHQEDTHERDITADRGHAEAENRAHQEDSRECQTGAANTANSAMESEQAAILTESKSSHEIFEEKVNSENCVNRPLLHRMA